MTRLWKLSVALLLGLSTLPALAIEPNVRALPRANHTGFTDRRLFDARSLPAAPNIQPNIQNVQRAAAMQQQAVQVNRPPAFPAQGVNTLPGQGPSAPVPNNLGNNMQGQPFVNPNNLLDEFGAPIQRAQAFQNQQNQQNQFGQSGISPQRNIDPAIANSGFVSGAPIGAGGFASTVDEGLLTGQARAMQGAGEYNRNTAEAVKTLELARAIALDNARNGLKTYFELKRINADNRAKISGGPISKEKLDEWNRQDQPDRLTRAQYNTDTGSIRWPALLQLDAFADQRIVLEELFARRTAGEFGPHSDFYRQVAHATQVLKDRLKDSLRNDEKFYTDEEYISSQNFLSSLAHEARLAPDLDGLAAN
jgi:hypothetical protein